MLIPFSQLKNSIVELGDIMFAKQLENYIHENNLIKNSCLLNQMAILRYNSLGFVELMFLSPIRFNIYAVQVEPYIKELILEENFDNPNLKKILPKYHFSLCSQVKNMIQNNSLYSKYKFKKINEPQTHLVFYKHNKPSQIQLKYLASPCVECTKLTRDNLLNLSSNKKKSKNKVSRKFDLIELDQELNNEKFLHSFLKSNYIQYSNNTAPVKLKCNSCLKSFKNNSSNFHINLVKYFKLESSLKIRLKCERCERKE